MREIEPQLRRFLSTWQLWMGIAWIAIVVVVVGLVVIRNETITTAARLDREQNLHRAEVKSTAQSTYNACAQSIPTLRKISLHLEGVNEIATALVANTKALLDTTSPGLPDYAVRRENYLRLRRAQQNVAALRDLPVPTLQDCAARRAAVLIAGGLR